MKPYSYDSAEQGPVHPREAMRSSGRNSSLGFSQADGRSFHPTALTSDLTHVNLSPPALLRRAVDRARAGKHLVGEPGGVLPTLPGATGSAMPLRAALHLAPLCSTLRLHLCYRRDGECSRKVDALGVADAESFSVFEPSDRTAEDRLCCPAQEFMSHVFKAPS